MSNRVFVARHHMEAHLLCGLLQSEGIPAEVRREFLLPTVEAGAVIPGMQPEVWILEPGQLPRALGVVDAYLRGDEAPAGDPMPWQCPTCGESHPPAFTHCWRCGEPYLGR